MKKVLIALVVAVVSVSLFSCVSRDVSAETVITELSDWNFTKDGAVSQVTLPHTCNAADGKSDSMFRGSATYSRTIELSEQQAANKVFLRFNKAGQKATVTVNSHTFDTHYGGYTPFVYDISDYVTAGANSVSVVCDNSLDWDLIPISADFNFNNGLYDMAYLIECGPLYFDPVRFGQDRMHLTQSNVSESGADLKIEAGVISSVQGGQNVTVSYNVKDMSGNSVANGNDELSVSGSTVYTKNVTIPSPTLWDGENNPYLYTVELSLSGGGITSDNISAKVGFRYFSFDAEQGFMLNGKSYPLRGFAMHQDYENAGSAATRELIDSDFAIVKESGANMLRLAHYPHNDYAYSKCDELGIIVQTEIPWINHCGENAGSAYFEHIKQNMQEMIVNFYNHPSIVFFGMSNELNGNHLKGISDAQGAYSYSKAAAWTRELYDFSKSLTQQHLIGMVMHEQTLDYNHSKLAEWSYLDWIGMNIYKGWYGGSFSEFGAALDDYKKYYPNLCVTEYGAGANPSSHSTAPMLTTVTGTGGERHDEEYQNLYHESYLDQIHERPSIGFTSVWSLFDFAVASRNEGGMPYLNDKGLVTRDRQTRKDAFYLYKAYMSEEPTVYITSRRYTTRDNSNIGIKVYSNCESLSLYQNGELKQTMTAPSSVSGVVWKFDDLTINGSDSFKVVGTKNGNSYTDEATFAFAGTAASGGSAHYSAEPTVNGTAISATVVNDGDTGGAVFVAVGCQNGGPAEIETMTVPYGTTRSAEQAGLKFDAEYSDVKFYLWSAETLLPYN